MTAPRLVYITAPDAAAARALGRTLIEERLAACANVLPGMTAIYRWQGAIEQADEAVLILKTAADRVAALTERVRALHPYRVPCVVTLPIEGGNAEFLAWITGETR